MLIRCDTLIIFFFKHHIINLPNSSAQRILTWSMLEILIYWKQTMFFFSSFYLFSKNIQVAS
jgi:hypothetical protein